jgi:hypothetical protein
VKPFFLLLACILWVNGVSAQNADSIYIHLYTDSLKKGSYNYINIDRLLSNGRYVPLDSNDVIFSSSVGFFSGNSLFLPHDCMEDKVNITVKLKNSNIIQAFTMYIKRKEDNPLPTLEEISKPKKKIRNP